MEDIAKAFAQEVKQIFNTAPAQEDIRKATANLEAARQFFPGDYANARNAGQTPDQLTALINGSDGPGLAKLRADADLMATWVGDPSLVDGGQATINQAATLYLAIQSFICVIHRELSKQATDATVKATELADMKTAASTALTTMKDIVMKVVVTRCQSLSVGQWSTSVWLPPPDGGKDTHYGATLQDGWAWCQACGVLHHDGSGDACPMMDPLGPHGPPVAQSPQVLMLTGDSGSTDIQAGWRWCHKCASLHWPSGPSVCPTGGAHSTDGSGAYMMEYLGNWPLPA